jgi:hypothetical protein
MAAQAPAACGAGKAEGQQRDAYSGGVQEVVAALGENCQRVGGHGCGDERGHKPEVKDQHCHQAVSS